MVCAENGTKEKLSRKLGSGAHGVVFHANMWEKKQKIGRGRASEKGGNIYIYIYYKSLRKII